MAFKLGIFELHTFCVPEYRHEPMCGEVRFDHEAQMMFRLLGQYGITSVITSSSLVDSIENINLSGIESLIDEICFHVTDREEEIHRLLACRDISPQDAFYVDDIACGIRQAKRAGIVSTFGVIGGYDSRERIIEEAPFYLAPINSMARITRIAYAQLGF